MKKTLLILLSALPLFFVSCGEKENADKAASFGIEAIDLGLSVEWADKNLGAKSTGDAGYYFMWGETQPKDNYAWAAYKYGSSADNLTKYNNSDGKINLDLSDDPAHILLGGKWRTPTSDEWLELINACTWTWGKQDGANGALAQAPDGTTVFFPAAGGKIGGSLMDVGVHGYYWMATRLDDTPSEAWSFYFHSKHVGNMNFPRNYGIPVRAVRDKE